jgi:MFS superfamily sulfate permease-like transporter
MAVLVMAGKHTAGELHAGGFVAGAVMLLLAVSGGLQALARVVPLCAVRGVQVGLGIALAQLALREYVPAHGPWGYALAAAGFAVMVLLSGRRRVPAGLVLVALGLAVAFAFRIDRGQLAGVFGVSWPRPAGFTLADVSAAWLALVPAQIALSLGNSIIATERTVADLFPDRPISARRLGVTYGLMNLVAPWTGGIPVCHGCGGLAGHYALGARTGGSVVIAGSYYLFTGLFAAGGFKLLLEVFPPAILGVLLFVEAVALVRLCADQAADPHAFAVVAIVALAAVGLPHGYAIGLAVGTLLGRMKWGVGA